MIVIDGQTFNVEVESVRRTADFLDKYAERTEDGDLKRELIGVYFNYTLQLFGNGDTAEYDRLLRQEHDELAGQQAAAQNQTVNIVSETRANG